MADGRKNNGGKRKGAGRKPRAAEDSIRRFAIDAIKDVYGSEEAGWRYIAEKAKDSYPHLALLYGYAYGKPVETKNVSISAEQPLFNLD